MHLTLIVWATLVLAAGATGGIKGRGLEDPSDHQPSEDPKQEDPLLPWKAEVTPAWTGLPVRVTLEVKGVLGTGALYLAGGDGTSVTFLASGHTDRVTGSPPAGHTYGEWQQKKEQITLRGGDNNNGLGYESHPTHTRWPLASRKFQLPLHGDMSHLAAPPVVCPLFAMADKNDGNALRTPVYDLACREEVGGLILEATHVYTDPGKYQVDAHFLDELLGVVTGRWDAQVEVKELLQVTLGSNRALPLQDGRSVAAATLSLTPSTHPLPLPCPGGLISWSWDFGDGTGEKGGECTSEEAEKEEEERMTRERKRGEGKDSDFLRNAEKRTENFAGLEESGGEEKKEVESTDKRAGERRRRRRRKAEGSKEQKKDSPDSTAPSLSYFASSSSTSATAASPSTSIPSTSISGISEIEKHDSNTAATSLPSPHPPSVPFDTSASASDASVASTLSTTSGPDDVPFTTTSTITPIPTLDTAATIINHTYTAPGIYNMSVQLLCGCRRVAGKDISEAFTVAVPIGDVQISVSETHLLLPLQGEPGYPPATQEVVMTVQVTNGSFLYPVTLHTDDGTQVLLQPTLSDSAGPWVAEAKHKYRLPGEYRPWVEVGNPVGERRAALHTVIKVDQPPNSVVLVPNTYLAAVGEVVVFTAKASGTLSSLHYDWQLPGGEVLQDAGPVVTRTYSSPFYDDTVSVQVYHDAHAHTPALPRPQASAYVTVEAPLTEVQLFVNDKESDIILQKNKLAYLKAAISPPEAKNTSRFFWYLNHESQRWKNPEMHYKFSTPGEVSLQVVVENQLSHVISPEVRLLVVEKLGDVRGVADYDSVLVRQERNYTVLVGRGSDITYTWDFGDHHTATTNVPTTTHTYWMAGTHTLTVHLTTPLGDLHVVTSKVFVLKSGKCDTPKVLAFYPRDASTEREFDMTQEILVEPEILRDCPLGSGPVYCWTIWDEKGQVVPLSNTRLDTPSLLIHPVYDHGWPDATKKAVGDVLSFPLEEETTVMNGLAPRTLEDGKYITQLTMKENGTIVEASFNTTFRVVASRFRVTFVDGTEREVDRNSNVTLRVEVTSPSPNFTLNWDCSPLDYPGASCFSEPGIVLNSFNTTTNIGDSFLSRLYHLWELLLNNGNRNSDGTKSHSSSGSFFPQPSEAGDSHFLHKVFNSSQHYIVTLTFPASILVDTYSRFHFSASGNKDSRHPVNVSQLVVVKSSRDNIGIQTCLGSQFPFGALRRMVFESECMSCSPEELAALQYSWSLNVVMNEQYTATLDWEGQQTPASEAEVTLKRSLKRIEVDGTFLPRPSDYLRIYKRSTLQEKQPRTAREEDSNPDRASPTPHLSTHDLQNLPGVITPEILAQAAEIYQRWGRLRSPSQDSSGGPHMLLASRMKRSLNQDNLTVMLQKENSNPLRPVGDPGVTDSILSDGLGGEGARAPGSPLAATRHAQRRQMRKSDRTSSSQTNMRRKVVGRHSGEAALGPVTDEATLPAPGSPTAPAPNFVKVTLDSHLVHRPAHIPRMGAEGEKGEGPATHLSAGEEWQPKPYATNAAIPEAEHQSGHTEPPHYQHRQKRNSGAEKIAKTYDIAVESPWLAAAQRVDHSGSRRSGVEWEAMGKVFDGEEAAQQHQVIPSKRKVQENEYLKIMEEEEEEEVKEEKKEVEEKEKRLWRANDGDHGVRDNPPDGGSDRKEERRPVTEAVRGATGVPADVHDGLNEDAERNVVKPQPYDPAEARKAAPIQGAASEVWSRRVVMTREAPPLHSAAATGVGALTKTAIKREDRLPSKLTRIGPGPPLQVTAVREERRPERQRPDHPHGQVASRPAPPPRLSPHSVASRPDSKERDQFSSGVDHAVRGSVDPRLSALQQRRGVPGRNPRGRTSTTKTLDQPDQRTDLQRLRGRVKKRRKKERLKIMSKPEQREGGKDKGRQEVRGGDVSGGAAPRHAEEQEVGYKENYLTSRVGVKVAEDDANDAYEAQNDVGNASGARQVARTSRPAAHQHGDSAHTPVSLTLRSPAGRGGAAATPPEALAAAGLPWDERERRQSTVSGGGGRVRGSEPSHSLPTEARPPRPQPDPAMFSSSAPLEYQDIPTAPPRGPHPVPNFRVLDYHEYKKLYMAQPDHRKIDSHATSGPDRSTGNPTRKAGGRESEGRVGADGDPPHGADGKAPNHTAEDGMGKAALASQSSHARLGPADHLAEEREDALSLSPPTSRLTTTAATTSGPARTAQYTTQKNSGWNAVEAADGGWGVGSGLAGGGQGEAGPRGFPRLHPPLIEGQARASRGPGYGEKLVDFEKRTGTLPDFSCRPENWDECYANGTTATHVKKTLYNTLGDPGNDLILNPETTQEVFVTEVSQVNVVLFRQLTSTGIHNPVLVLYMDLLSTSQSYILYLNTHNTLTNKTGCAKQLIEFSPAPTLKHCEVIPRSKAQKSYFRASCSDVEGHFYPVMLQWSYRFLRLGSRTVFYHGARTSFDFILPPGLDSNEYRVYVSVRAIDGKGVSYKYPDFSPQKVLPRSNSSDDVLSIFQEISTLENESPPLLLQEVRTLAWELNILESSSVTQTVIDNILTIVFYRTTCNMLSVEINSLKSCARDHLAEKVASNPMRDEMEVIQALTTLQIIIDANENISSTTYLRVLSSMNTAAERMWFSYYAEVRTEAAQEYFILSSAMLDKQTEVFDKNATSIIITTNIITRLLDLMEVETSARVREEKPLTWTTNSLTFYGYWAEAENINRWNNTVPFLFEPGTVTDRVHLVQALVHTMSPFNLPVDPITSEVVYLSIDSHHKANHQVTATLRHSLKRAGSDSYDFRRDGVISPESLSVYEFDVENEQQLLVLNVLLEVTQVLNSQYPAAAVVLICDELQNLKEPLYKQELMATLVPSKVMLSVPPNGLSTGKKLVIIMDKNSYENNWGRYNTSTTVIGAEFKVSAWWSRCLVWDGSLWDGGPCYVNSKLSSWDSTVCSCNSKYTVYGAQTIPVLDEESTVDVNELMLHETYIALYFIMLLLVVYFLLALAVQTSDRHRLRRRNIWLRDNKLEHEWAYLLTIKTGTQWNAGTTSKVYAILHGTHGMSETRELQSKQTGQLFTRGALCTFILTTPESLGDILKVQVWHDNSGGSESGWFVCETSVADLVLGAIYIYPCYRWLSVQAEDAKVEREITLESPTTFLQDFEHFLPQYASEHMLWTSLLTTSSTAKLYRLQRLTICLIVCLCLGTVSLWVVKRINNEHTMMVPDMHIESLYYGVTIAVVLLPIQWVLEMIFKMSNKVEEKEYNAKAVLDTLRATKGDTSTLAGDMKSTQVPSDGDDDIYDPEAEIWKNIRKWSLSTEVSLSGAELLHPTLLRDLETENMEITQRSRSSMENISRISRMSQSDGSISAIQPESLPPNTSMETEPNEVDESSEETDKKCSSPLFRLLPKFLRPLVSWCLSINKVKNKQHVQEDWKRGEEEEDEDDEDAERDDLRVASSITFIFSQCVGWIVCCIFVALCCMVLYVRGSGMPMDYGALWIHIIYVTLCCSVFVMQPLVVIIYTFYKVCVYRWLGCRGCISSCITVPLDQVVAIWNRYQTALRRQTPTVPDSSNEKLLEERQRTRDLRSAHPPSEDYLLKCREKEIRREKVYSLFCNTLGHLVFLVLLIIIADSADIYKRFTLNTAILSSLKNGSCLDYARYEDDPCTMTNGDFCNQIPNEDYVTFHDIKTKDDWWNWTNTELLALTYSNHDESFSAYNIFCDSNSIIIGQPRLRKYDSSSQNCEASKFKIDTNRSMADLLKIGKCFPEYVDEVPHLFSFGSNQDKEYEWDAHFLAVTHGLYSRYSYTSYKQALSSSQFGSAVMLYFLQASNWLSNNSTRAVVTEFTLYHPQTNMYTTLNLLAEFPSLSGAEVTTFISSSHIERYESSSSGVCSMLAEAILLAVAMYYLKRAALYIYSCRFRIWKSFWGLLDVLMTILSWSYVVCLMLRVQIAEDAMWQLRVAYFQKFVNLKGLTTWDGVLDCLIGCMLAVHLLRCLSLLKYLPRSYHLGLVLASAWKDVKIISVCLLVLLIAFMCLGNKWFNYFLWEFHSSIETVLTIFKVVMARLPFLRTIEEQSTGVMSWLGYLYYLLTYIFLYQLVRALFVAAFLNARRSFIDKPGVDVSWNDVTLYVKERYQSLLRKIHRKKKEEESQPADNTPPDFYMAELELQINQVMNGLESLAESMGLVVDRMNRLEDTQSSFSDPHDTEDDNYSYSNDEVWNQEDSESRSSISRDEEDTRWEFLQQQQQGLRDYDCKLETDHCKGARPRLGNEAMKGRKISVDKSINLDAFTDIGSCQTEIEALAHKLTLGDPTFELVDDGGTLEKFLKDVSESFDNFTSFGKYGKTQLRVNTRIHPSHESLNLSHNNSGVTESISHQRGIHTDNADGSVPRGISSRLCRTQTQGRGKGHVEALDISCLESDHEDQSNCE